MIKTILNIKNNYAHLMFKNYIKKSNIICDFIKNSSKGEKSLKNKTLTYC